MKRLCEHALVCAANDCCGYGEPTETKKTKAKCFHAARYFRSCEIILVEVPDGKKSVDTVREIG